MTGFPTTSGAPEPGAGERPPPVTGQPSIDAALGELPGLSELPVSDHHAQLAQAHAVLDRLLDRDGVDGA